MSYFEKNVVLWFFESFQFFFLQIDDYSLVRFMPFDRSDEEGINIVLQHIDFTIQYGEDLEVKEPKVTSITPWVLDLRRNSVPTVAALP